jgi:hypothetical protein
VQWLVAEVGCCVMSERDAHGYPAFLVACSHGHTDVARWLVAHVGDTILQDDALRAARVGKHWATCEWLIDEHNMVPVRCIVPRVVAVIILRCVTALLFVCLFLLWR